MNDKIGSVLVTGGAGFIGSHLVDRLLEEGWKVTVVDSFDPFYDPVVKWNNIKVHLHNQNFRLVEVDIRDMEALRREAEDDYDVIVHLAARAGVRPSLLEPVLYNQVNVGGTQNLLELARRLGVRQFVFGSSSSVYGINPNVPWHENDSVLRPISPYASTKVSGELLGHVYAHLYNIRFIALRFFTVYGPRQRPDLAIHKFARLLVEDLPVPVFGNGSTRRDYTYVSDIIQGIRSAMAYSQNDFELFNLGNDSPVVLMDLIEKIGAALRIKPRYEFKEEQPGDVPQTWASITRARNLLNYSPSTDLETGLQHFADWFLRNYKDSASSGQIQ